MSMDVRSSERTTCRETPSIKSELLPSGEGIIVEGCKSHLTGGVRKEQIINEAIHAKNGVRRDPNSGAD
jgi:hypothetical protein